MPVPDGSWRRLGRGGVPARTDALHSCAAWSRALHVGARSAPVTVRSDHRRGRFQNLTHHRSGSSMPRPASDTILPKAVALAGTPARQRRSQAVWLWWPVLSLPISFAAEALGVELRAQVPTIEPLPLETARALALLDRDHNRRNAFIAVHAGASFRGGNGNRNVLRWRSTRSRDRPGWTSCLSAASMNGHLPSASPPRPVRRSSTWSGLCHWQRCWLSPAKHACFWGTRVAQAHGRRRGNAGCRSFGLTDPAV